MTDLAGRPDASSGAPTGDDLDEMAAEDDSAASAGEMFVSIALFVAFVLISIFCFIFIQ